jgi:hypothetical protein
VIAYFTMRRDVMRLGDTVKARYDIITITLSFAARQLRIINCRGACYARCLHDDESACCCTVTTKESIEENDVNPTWR